MDDAREHEQWSITSTIMAMLQKCQTEESSNIPWNPDAWNRPLQAQVMRQKAEKAAAEKRRLEAAKQDPEQLAALARERRMAFEAFRSMLR